jgi:transposase
MGHRRKLGIDVDTQVQCVLEGIAGKPVSELCRRYGISQWQYYRIRDRFLEGGKSGLAEGAAGDQAREKQLQSQIEELERTVGRLTMENRVLKKTLP